MAAFSSTLLRLVAFGGVTALTGTTTYIFNKKPSSKVDCRPLTVYDNDAVLIPTLKKKKWDDNWDLLGIDSTTTLSEKDRESESETPKPTATRHIILVRHGQYVQDSSGDDKLRILTDIGRQQATLTGERLEILGMQFDKIVASTMTRAQETCNLMKIAYPDIEKDNCSLLREGAPYPVEPMSTVWKPDERQFYEDNPRIEAAFRKYIRRADPKQEKDSYELLVCHGNVIRYFVCRALQLPPEGWLRMAVANCGFTWLAIRPNGRVSLRAFGDVGHLPPELITYN